MLLFQFLIEVTLPLLVAVSARSLKHLILQVLIVLLHLFIQDGKDIVLDLAYQHLFKLFVKAMFHAELLGEPRWLITFHHEYGLVVSFSDFNRNC